jgi:hypothetical protein
MGWRLTISSGAACPRSPGTFAQDSHAHTLWRSVDDGAHWTQLQFPFPTTDLASPLRYEPRTDGPLVVDDPTHRTAYVLAAGASEFAAVAVDQHLFADHVGSACIKPVVDGAPFAVATARPPAYDVSSDCVHWGRLPFPVG